MARPRTRAKWRGRPGVLAARERASRLEAAADLSARHTKERLLDAAEALYAERGIQSTSLRDITARATANLAAVNYHFGSKDSLTEEVFRRHLDPLNAERIEILTRAERAAGRRGPSVEDILHAFCDPTVKLWREHPAFIRLLGRLQFEPDEKLHLFYLSRFEEVLERFQAATTRALPRLPLREILWRSHFVVGALVNTWTCHYDLEYLSRGLCKAEPYEAVLHRLIAFGAAGLRAGVPEVPRGRVEAHSRHPRLPCRRPSSRRREGS